MTFLDFFKSSKKTRSKKRLVTKKNTDDEKEKSIDIKIGNTIPFQITRKKKEKRVVLKSGNVSRMATYFQVKGIAGRYFHVDPKFVALVKKGKKDVWTLQYDVNYSEPLSPNKDVAEYSQEVENTLIGSYVEQLINVAIVKGGFTIDRNTYILMGVTACLFIFAGFSINPLFNIVPNTIVHWLSAVPKAGS